MADVEKTWWESFKVEAVSALAKLIVWGSGILITWAVFYAFIGKHEMEKVSENLNIRITNEFNESVKRDAEMTRKIERLKVLLNKLLKLPIPPHPHPDDYYERHHKDHVPIQQQQQVLPAGIR